MSKHKIDKELEIEVCYSPALFPVYFRDKNCIVVVIDIFRATSAICTAFENGVKKMIPVSTVDEAKEYQDKGMIAAAERHGEVVDGFDFGNSPFNYKNPELKGKTIVMTTTNGTKAIERAKAADSVIIGSFLNIDAVCRYLERERKNVILLCSGWRDRYNLEDSLFAGAVVNRLKNSTLNINLADSSMAANHLFETSKGDYYEFLKSSSHRKRLTRLDLEDDINYCLQENITDVLPIYRGNALILENEEF